jgi:hypothetical protein
LRCIALETSPIAALDRQWSDETLIAPGTSRIPGGRIFLQEIVEVRLAR